MHCLAAANMSGVKEEGVDYVQGSGTEWKEVLFPPCWEDFLFHLIGPISCFLTSICVWSMNSSEIKGGRGIIFYLFSKNVCTHDSQNESCSDAFKAKSRMKLGLKP